MFNPFVFSDYYDKELLSQENICGDLFPEARMLCIRMDLGVKGRFPRYPQISHIAKRCAIVK